MATVGSYAVERRGPSRAPGHIVQEVGSARGKRGLSATWLLSAMREASVYLDNSVYRSEPESTQFLQLVLDEMPHLFKKNNKDSRKALRMAAFLCDSHIVPKSPQATKYASVLNVVLRQGSLVDQRFSCYLRAIVNAAIKARQVDAATRTRLANLMTGWVQDLAGVRPSQNRNMFSRRGDDSVSQRLLDGVALLSTVRSGGLVFIMYTLQGDERQLKTFIRSLVILACKPYLPDVSRLAMASLLKMATTSHPGLQSTAKLRRQLVAEAVVPLLRPTAPERVKTGKRKSVEASRGFQSPSVLNATELPEEDMSQEDLRAHWDGHMLSMDDTIGCHYYLRLLDVLIATPVRRRSVGLVVTTEETEQPFQEQQQQLYEALVNSLTDRRAAVAVEAFSILVGGAKAWDNFLKYSNSAVVRTKTSPSKRTSGSPSDAASQGFDAFADGGADLLFGGKGNVPTSPVSRSAGSIHTEASAPLQMMSKCLSELYSGTKTGDEVYVHRLMELSLGFAKFLFKRFQPVPGGPGLLPQDEAALEDAAKLVARLILKLGTAEEAGINLGAKAKALRTLVWLSPTSRTKATDLTAVVEEETKSMWKWLERRIIAGCNTLPSVYVRGIFADLMERAECSPDGSKWLPLASALHVVNGFCLHRTHDSINEDEEKFMRLRQQIGYSCPEYCLIAVSDTVMHGFYVCKNDTDRIRWREELRDFVAAAYTARLPSPPETHYLSSIALARPFEGGAVPRAVDATTDGGIASQRGLLHVSHFEGYAMEGGNAPVMSIVGFGSGGAIPSASELRKSMDAASEGSDSVVSSINLMDTASPTRSHTRSGSHAGSDSSRKSGRRQIRSLSNMSDSTTPKKLSMRFSSSTPARSPRVKLDRVDDIFVRPSELDFILRFDGVDKRLAFEKSFATFHQILDSVDVINCNYK